MTDQSYKELNQEEYLRLQTSLLREKGDDAQRQFLEAVKEPDAFLAFIDERVRIVGGSTPVLFDGALTESSFKEPTQDQERRIYEILRHVSPRTACRVSFWATVTIEHVRSGKIAEPTWLASNGGNNESGDERIDRALYTDGHGTPRSIDDCVRTVFRRMSGLPAARGNRSVFVNPTFGRAWWRERLVSRITQRGSQVQSRDSLLEVVRRSQEYWERLVTMIVSRGSVFGSVDVQDALVNTLATHMSLQPDTPLQNTPTLSTLLRRFSNLSSSIEMGVLNFDEISEVVKRLISQVAVADRHV